MIAASNPTIIGFSREMLRMQQETWELTGFSLATLMFAQSGQTNAVALFIPDGRFPTNGETRNRCLAF